MSTTPATPAKPANTFKSDGVAGGRKWTLDHPQGNDLLAYGMTALHALFPYWTESSYTLQPVFVEGYGTLGVTKRRVLIVDPCVISTWCRVTLATVLAHELGHGFANHHDRAADISAIPELFNFACFPPGTLLPSGVPIESAATMTTPHDGVLVTVTSQAGPLTATPEHPVFTRRRRHKVGLTPIRLHAPDWCPLTEVRVGDYVCVPRLERYGLRDDTEIDLRPYIVAGTDSKGRATFGNRAIKSVPLSEDVAWLIGLYVAEGSASPNVRLSLGTHETELIAEVKRIAEAIGSHASSHANGTSTNVDLGAVVLGRWLKSECGASAHTKHVPAVILRHRDPKVRAAFLRGVHAGDGCTTTRSGRRWLTVAVASEALIRDLFLLLAQDGVGGAYTRRVLEPRAIGEGYTDVRTVLHSVTWSDSPLSTTTRVLNGKTVPSHSRRWRADEHGVWYPVNRVESRPYTGPVHNIVNTPDHTYVASGFLVHNCDAELNDDLVEDKRVKWPWAPFLPANIPVPDGKGGTTGAPTGLLAEDYYRLLMESATKPQARGVCAGECGGIAGNPGEGEGELDGDDGGGKPGEKKGEGEGQTEGDLDRLFGRSDAQLEIDRLAVAEAMEAAEAKRQGTVPSGLMRIVKTLRRPAVVRWQDQLAQFFRGHITRRPGGAHASYRSPNRKQAGLGYGVGAPRMTVTHATTPVVWVAIDTSGSMGMAELVAGISEVRHLIAAAGARVRFLACDAAVHTDIDVTDGTDLGALLKGGGGTSFRPVFDRAADARHGRAGGVAAPDLLVFYTDGYGDAPEVPPPFKTIWLLSGKNTRKPAEWGDCITIPVHGV